MSVLEEIITRRAYLRAGDMATIAEKVGCTTQTVRNALSHYPYGVKEGKENEAVKEFFALTDQRKKEAETRRQELINLAQS